MQSKFIFTLRVNSVNLVCVRTWFNG